MKTECLELRKLYCNYFVLLALLLIFMLNVLTSYYVYQDQENGKLMYSASAYRKLHSDIENMEDEEAKAYLMDYYDKICKDYLAGAPLQLRYADDFEREVLLLTHIEEDMEQCIHYQTYLNERKEQVTCMIYSGLSDISGDYNKRNMEQTLHDYESVEDLSVIYGPSKGVELFGNMISTDFYVIVAVLIVIVQLITRERESQQLILYKATYRGHQRLIFAKINVVMVSMFGIVLLFYGCNLLLGQQMYGFGNLSRPIQSVSSYADCTLQLSVCQYLMLFVLMKVIVHAFLASITLFVAVVVSNARALYFMLSIIYGMGAVCYFGISATSKFSFWKYINVFAMLKSGDMLGRYQNLNILGVPYSYRAVGIVIMVVLMGLLLYLAIMQFDVQREAVLTAEKQQPIRLLQPFGKSFSLFCHETYKLLFDGKLLFILFMYCVYIGVSYKPVTEAFYIAQDVYYDAYIDYVKGPITEETAQFLEKETQKYEQIETEGIRTEDMAYYEYLLQPYQAFVKLRDIITPYLQEVEGEYLHDTGYRLLSGDAVANNKDIKLGLLAVVILIFPLSYLYGIEYQQNTINLLKTTYYGRGKTFLVKLLLGLLTVTIVYVLTYAPFYYSVLSEYGTESIHAPACSLQNLANVPQTVSILQYLIFVAIFRYMGLAFMMLGLFYVSSKTKSVIGTCITGVLLVVLPLVFVYLQVPGAVYLLLNPFLIGNVF